MTSMLHAKILIADDTVIIGSSNLDSRSLFHDLESDVRISFPENILMIQEQFKKDLTFSKEISLERWKKRSFLQKLLESIFLCFRAII